MAQTNETGPGAPNGSRDGSEGVMTALAGASASGRDALRQDLVDRFAAWLDQALAEEELPPGADEATIEQFLGSKAGPDGTAPEGCDLFSLWSAMTALSQEVKLQGRAFGRLDESLRPVVGLAERLDAHLAALREATAAAVTAGALAADCDRAALRQAERRGADAALAFALDLRDRLRTSLDAARGLLDRDVGGSLWRRLRLRLGGTATRDACLALCDGCSLTLARIDDYLSGCGVQEIPCALGAAFDPSRMRATHVDRRPGLAAGTVCAVLRPGYLRGGEVMRYVDVSVAAAPMAGSGSAALPATDSGVS